jgi:hypothetical protein
MTAPAMKIPQMGSSIDKDLAANTQVVTTRKRGRPKNGDSTYRRAGIKKWYPKKWTAQHEQIVSLDVMGVSHVVIAEKFDVTVQHVSKICNTPQAKIIRRASLNSLSERNKIFQEERFARAQNQAMDRISSVLEDDQLFSSDPFAVVDKAFKLLQGSGAIAGKEKGDTHIHAKNITVNTLKQTAIVELKDGLAKAREAKEMHSGMEPVDVTSPKVETGRME